MWSRDVGSPDIPQTTADVDRIVQHGTYLDHSVCSHGGYLMVNELPESFVFGDASSLLTIHEPSSGMVSQVSDNPES